ncbi:MAG: YifB family Mg chelatase-like AAA ATPase [Pseudomonadales bacterium]|nr:YifB family Mg chelatase-like AAA ATPase [Pseudomonadales bacterium]NRA15991.1 YifB family Mg chelatase-like AAA ATPase [Oceanospirillaceae bacterium]
MSLAKVFTRAQLGVCAPLVEVEVHLCGGLPAFQLVGLPEAAVRESKERVRSALINLGFDFPQRRITVNLAPADLPKEGGRYDLAIAVGILAASKQVPDDLLSEWEFIGELALSGELRRVTGVLPVAVGCQANRRKLCLPKYNQDEALLIRALEIAPAENLLQVCHLLSGQLPLFTPAVATNDIREHLSRLDLADVKGQFQAKRALEIAAAGGHHILMSGSPGSGKSMLAARLAGLLPELTEAERIESAAVYSVAGIETSAICAGIRPFRSPHHTASAVSLVGGGSYPQPGEISLAHNGVLFLDEVVEFPRKVLEVLREPLEAGSIHISRAAQKIAFPARFQLVAAMNPCPCGYALDVSGRCRCSPDQVKRYQAKMSGPLLDRIDLHIQVNPVPAEDLLSIAKMTSGEHSAQVAKRVSLSAQLQIDRQSCRNALLEGKQLQQVCFLDSQLRELLVNAATKLQLSARACTRVLKVSRSIADLEQQRQIQRRHLLEALSYRRQELASY